MVQQSVVPRRVAVTTYQGRDRQLAQRIRRQRFSLYPRYTRDAFLDRIRQSPEFIRFLRENPGFVDLADHEFDWPREIMKCGEGFFRHHQLRYTVSEGNGPGLFT